MKRKKKKKERRDPLTRQESVNARYARGNDLLAFELYPNIRLLILDRGNNTTEEEESPLHTCIAFAKGQWIDDTFSMALLLLLLERRLL